MNLQWNEGREIKWRTLYSHDRYRQIRSGYNWQVHHVETRTIRNSTLDGPITVWYSRPYRSRFTNGTLCGNPYGMFLNVQHSRILPLGSTYADRNIVCDEENWPSMGITDMTAGNRMGVAVHMCQK